MAGRIPDTRGFGGGWVQEGRSSGRAGRKVGSSSGEGRGVHGRVRGEARMEETPGREVEAGHLAAGRVQQMPTSPLQPLRSPAGAHNEVKIQGLKSDILIQHIELITQ